MGCLQYTGWHTQTVLCIALSEKITVNICCEFKRTKNHLWTPNPRTTRENWSDQVSPALWRHHWAFVNVPDEQFKGNITSEIRRIWTSWWRENKKTLSNKTSGLGGTTRICHWFYLMSIFRSLGKDMQNRYLQKVSDTCSNNRAPKNIQHILWCMDMGINGN